MKEKINWKDNLTEETVTWESLTDEIESSEQLEEFINENMADQKGTFSDFINDYVAEHDLELPLIMKRSNIDKGYFYNIVNGDRQPKRDKLISICIGAGMDVKHLNRALRICKYSKLDPKSERDLRIKFAIKNGADNVIDVNIMLDEAGLEPLE